MNEILYLKIDRNTEIDHVDVRLGDVAKLECTNVAVKNRLKTLKLLKIQADKSNRYIFSIMKVVELIHEVYPDLEIQNLGETDFIIEYESPEYAKGRWNLLKVVLLCITIFFGSAFSIMAFNNDVGVDRVFHQVYELVMGVPTDGFTILEIMYSLGIAVGIIVFYNHFGGKRITKDPTPMEVQMRLYEDDVNTTLVEGCNREGTSIDVD
ncbi:MAG: stage V sporulation protein AA [Lachnospiraceae bacterium]|nr:stage V sporulation protein AA [Lachnospiraceae bacterium]